jgi:hypothetical protein
VTDDLRARIRRACAEADGFNFESLEAHDYQRHADAIVAALQAETDQAVRAVQGWMALDLHMALGKPVDHSATAVHQGHDSWADWWAGLCAEVRNRPSLADERDQYAAERDRYRAAWRSARCRATENEEEAQRQYASCQRAERLLEHATRSAAGKIAREPTVVHVEGPATEAALGQALVRGSEARAQQAEAERDRLAARVAELENAITWETTCLNCARILDSCYTETVRAEKAEAAVQRVREWLDQWGPRLPDGACSALDQAISGDCPGEGNGCNCPCEGCKHNCAAHHLRPPATTRTANNPGEQA